MDMTSTPARRRGRPPKQTESYSATREALLRHGVAVLTEKGYSSVGLDDILAPINVPKGSFYHYFASKEQFGAQLIARYAAYFAAKLDRILLNEQRSPLDRLHDFVADAQAGMARYDYRRGCLVGNLGQEMGTLPDAYRAQLLAVFSDWEARVARCLRAAQAAGQIAAQLDCDRQAVYFWIGWEGAVLRAKLARGPAALTIFADGFFAGLRP